jgi:MoxR-like ATPase
MANELTITQASTALAVGAAPAPLVAGAIPADLPGRLRALRDGLLTGLVERDVAIRLALLAALSGEHLLLIGPPGTAKSVLARRLHLAFKDATYFERLLTRFTVPEELFGPLSIKALEQDRYQRQTDRYLPTAAIAFLDEIFKANSAILNALLTLLNEREFDNGTEREKTPLISVVGASNELPAKEDGKNELGALYDRFLLRLDVGYVTDDGFTALLDLRGESRPEIDPSLRLSADNLVAVQSAAALVTVPGDVIALLRSWRKWCAEQSIEVSDRRWRKIVKLLQISALTNGRSVVSIWDAWLIQHCLWNEPEQREAVYQWYAERVGASAAMDPGRLTKIVVSWEGRLKRDRTKEGEQRDPEGRRLYQQVDGGVTVERQGAVQAKREGKPLYVARTRWLNRHGSYIDANEATNRGTGFTLVELNDIRVEVAGSWTYFRDWTKREDYLAAASNWLTTTGELPVASGPMQHKPEYIAAMIPQVEAVRRTVEAYRAQVVDHMAQMAATIETHLWVTPDFLAPAATTLNATLASVDGLLARLDDVRDGFESLPIEPAEWVDEEVEGICGPADEEVEDDEEEE